MIKSNTTQLLQDSISVTLNGGTQTPSQREEDLSPYQQSKAHQTKQEGSLSNRHPKWSLRNLSPKSSYHRATSSPSTHQDQSRRKFKHHMPKQSNSTSKKGPHKTNYESIIAKRSPISNPTIT
ncbi:hypothetical protein Dimus_038326 [Dionaea muscipula]